MKMHRMLLIAVLLTANVVWAQQNAIPSAPHILVYGEASAKAIPDAFSIVLHITVTDLDAAVARTRVEEIVQKVITSLRGVGVNDEEIVATSLALQPENNYNSFSGERVFKGTRVTRSINAIFSDTTGLEKFLEQTELNEELQLQGVQTGLSQESALMVDLRKRAIADCKQKAQDLAIEYGVSLQGIYSVSDVAPQFRYGISSGSWPAKKLLWDGDNSVQLDRVETTNSRVAAAIQTSFSTGYISFTDKIYTVFLISDKDES
jgi:uncharacterized protein YggE